mgnify:FL=1
MVVIASLLLILCIRTLTMAYERGIFHGGDMYGLEPPCVSYRSALNWVIEKNPQILDNGKPSLQDLRKAGHLDEIDKGFSHQNQNLFVCPNGGVYELLLPTNPEHKPYWKCSVCTPREIERDRRWKIAKEMNQKPLVRIKNGFKSIRVRDVFFIPQLENLLMMIP